MAPHCPKAIKKERANHQAALVGKKIQREKVTRPPPDLSRFVRHGPFAHGIGPLHGQVRCLLPAGQPSPHRHRALQRLRRRRRRARGGCGRLPSFQFRAVGSACVVLAPVAASLHGRDRLSTDPPPLGCRCTRGKRTRRPARASWLRRGRLVSGLPLHTETGTQVGVGGARASAKVT